MLGAILSVMGGINTVHDFYQKASGIITPNDNKQILQRIEVKIAGVEDKIERLNDNILYAPNMETVKDITQNRQRKIDDLRDVRESLEPIQKALGQEILSSAMILTPEKMQKALIKNPWEVLLDIQPVNLAAKPNNANMVPVLFNFNGVQFLGWQMRGSLPMLFNCNYEDLWQPDSQTLDVSSSSTVDKQEIDADKAAKRKAEQKREAKLEADKAAKPANNENQIIDVDIITLKKGLFGKKITLDMVSIPGGTFMMGSPESEKDREDNENQHQVTISPFYMGKYPVTQAQWQAVMGNNPSYFKGDNRPVESVSWNDAAEFCKKLSEMTGKNYRLATEAEWEYACRAGTTTPYYFGETITTDLVNYACSRGETTDVGSFPPNAFGLYDMHGNVWEWCQDYWGEYSSEAQTDPTGPTNGGSRVVRGGSWDDDARSARVACRLSFEPG